MMDGRRSVSAKAGDISVMVTGTGGPVGISIFKALRQSSLRPRIVATDLDPRSIGLYRADAAYVLPHVLQDRAAYLDALQGVIIAERVSMVCFGSEVEIDVVAPAVDDLERATGARLVLNSPSVLGRISDKWEFAGLLRQHSLPGPETVLASDATALRSLMQRHGFPLIIKPRRGSGSQRVFKVHSQRELDLLCDYLADAVVQEYLLPDDEEYTVGVYKSPTHGYIGQISLRRVLASGNTYKAEVVEDDSIEALCRDFCDRIDVWGPINLQLRKTTHGVSFFEANVRFSGSAVMRAYFGFNEPDMAMRDLVLGVRPEPGPIRRGVAFRYWDEFYLTPHEIEDGRASAEPSERVGTRLDLL